jgi:hypothetical protein
LTFPFPRAFLSNPTTSSLRSLPSFPETGSTAARTAGPSTRRRCVLFLPLSSRLPPRRGYSARAGRLNEVGLMRYGSSVFQSDFRRMHRSDQWLKGCVNVSLPSLLFPENAVDTQPVCSFDVKVFGETHTECRLGCATNPYVALPFSSLLLNTFSLSPPSDAAPAFTTSAPSTPPSPTSTMRLGGVFPTSSSSTTTPPRISQ